ncbi:MAG: RHS repeat protein [Candidatus Coatesbacteria bacterium]|nr:RHS repeat protein [Candidatus Coatesbacteria bacterium]
MRLNRQPDEQKREFCHCTDDLLRLTSITYPTGGTVTFGYATGSSLRTSIGMPNGAYTDLEYDLNGRIAGVETRNSGDTLLKSNSYEFDPVGRLTGILDESSNETVLEYDALGALTYASYPGGSPTSYYYDAAGFRTFASDEAGMTTEFDYDDAGQLLSSETDEAWTTEYDYDLNGNTVEKDDNGVVTEYEYNDKNGLIGAAGRHDLARGRLRPPPRPQREALVAGRAAAIRLLLQREGAERLVGPAQEHGQEHPQDIRPLQQLPPRPSREERANACANDG